MVLPLSRARTGQSMVEFGVILALVAAIAIVGLYLTGTSVKAIFCRLAAPFGVSCGALFAEDFTSLDAWKKVSGIWDSVDGELCGGTGEGKIFAPVTGTDYTIDIEITRLMQGDGYGLFFRAQDVEKVNGYTFQYDPGLKGFAFRKWVHGNEIYKPIAYAANSSFPWYDTNRSLQVMVSGSTFSAMIDGKEVLTVVDDTYSEGGVGLRTWDNTKACFDNLTVRSLR